LTLENSNDRQSDVTLGAARARSLGRESGGVGSDRGVSSQDRKALFISCKKEGSAQDESLIHVSRWQPPELTPHGLTDVVYASALAPLLTGEMYLGAEVSRIDPSQHLLGLTDGRQFVYDKLVSTLRLHTLASLLLHEVPADVRRDEMLRYWLSEADIEVADPASQSYYGEFDELAVGKLFADRVNEALSLKFPARGHARSFPRLFEPRLVKAGVQP